MVAMFNVLIKVPLIESDAIIAQVRRGSNLVCLQVKPVLLPSEMPLAGRPMLSAGGLRAEV
jgi:hypothetical protein